MGQLLLNFVKHLVHSFFRFQARFKNVNIRRTNLQIYETEK